MPSKSAAQHRFMEAAAHNPEFAKKAGISQKVAKEFAKADKSKKFKSVGDRLYGHPVVGSKAGEE